MASLASLSSKAALAMAANSQGSKKIELTQSVAIVPAPRALIPPTTSGPVVVKDEQQAKASALLLPARLAKDVKQTATLPNNISPDAIKSTWTLAESSKQSEQIRAQTASTGASLGNLPAVCDKAAAKSDILRTPLQVDLLHLSGPSTDKTAFRPPPNLILSPANSTTSSASSSIPSSPSNLSGLSTGQLGPGGLPICKYRTGKCANPRAMKANGELHSLCDEHRKKANESQRKLDRKKQAIKNLMKKRRQSKLPFGSEEEHMMKRHESPRVGAMRPVNSFDLSMAAISPHQTTGIEHIFFPMSSIPQGPQNQNMTQINNSRALQLPPELMENIDALAIQSPVDNVGRPLFWGGPDSRSTRTTETSSAEQLYANALLSVQQAQQRLKNAFDAPRLPGTGFDFSAFPGGDIISHTNIHTGRTSNSISNSTQGFIAGPMSRSAPTSAASSPLSASIAADFFDKTDFSVLGAFGEELSSPLHEGTQQQYRHTHSSHTSSSLTQGDGATNIREDLMGTSSGQANLLSVEFPGLDDDALSIADVFTIVEQSGDQQTTQNIADILPEDFRSSLTLLEDEVDKGIRVSSSSGELNKTRR